MLASPLLVHAYTVCDDTVLFVFSAPNFPAPLPLVHVRVSLKGTDFVTVAWDVPSGTVYDGFAYDFDFSNETLAELPAAPTYKKFESLDANSNYTVTLYVFSRHVDGTILYSLPIAFNFSTCVCRNFQAFFSSCCCMKVYLSLPAD